VVSEHIKSLKACAASYAPTINLVMCDEKSTGFPILSAELITVFQYVI